MTKLEARMVARVLYDVDDMTVDDRYKMFKAWNEDPRVLEIERAVAVTGWKDDGK